MFRGTDCDVCERDPIVTRNGTLRFLIWTRFKREQNVHIGESQSACDVRGCCADGYVCMRVLFEHVKLYDVFLQVFGLLPADPVTSLCLHRRFKVKRHTSAVDP